MKTPPALPLVVSVGLTATLIAFSGLAERLELVPAAVLAGEPWRAFTGHLSHYDPTHLLTNLLGLSLLLGVPAPRRAWHWWALFALCAAGVSLGLLLERQPLDAYRGLSGVLYGLWFAASLAPGRDVPTALRLLAPVLLLSVVLDAAGTQRALASGIAVHQPAHAYGLAAGFLGCAAAWIGHWYRLVLSPRRAGSRVQTA